MSKVETTPQSQKVYPWSIDGIDQDTKVSLQSTYKMIGNDIVLNNFSTTISYNNNNVNVTVHPGTAIQDSSLLELEQSEILTLNVSGLDQSGTLVSYIFFSEENSEFKLGLVYLDSSNSGDWDLLNNRIVLNTYEFTKDTYNSIISAKSTNQDYITINGTTYYRKGIHHDNIYISNLLISITNVSKYVKADHTATLNETVFVDTSNGPFNLYLPINPPIGTKVTIIDCAGTFWENSLRVEPNGSKINGMETHLFFRFKNSITDFYYSGDQYGWIYNITRMWSLKGGTF
ncbi:MAG: hypothetical protein ACOC2W_00485 [bacterium]